MNLENNQKLSRHYSGVLLLNVCSLKNWQFSAFITTFVYKIGKNPYSSSAAPTAAKNIPIGNKSDANYGSLYFTTTVPYSL